MSISGARRALWVVLAALLVLFYLVPGVRGFVEVAVGLLGAGAVLCGVLVYRPQRRQGWLLLALAVALLTAGDLTYNLITPGYDGRYPATPDVFYLAAYVPMAVGVLRLGQPPVPSRDWPMVLDTVALSLAGGLLVWISLVRPAVVTMHLTEAGKLTAVASWVGYVAVLAAGARVVLMWRSNRALAILGLGIVAFLVSDYLYGSAQIHGTWARGEPLDAGFLVFSGLCGIAALTPAMAHVASVRYARHLLGPWRLGMLAVALLVGPTVLLVEATPGPVTTGVAIAIVSAVVGVLMLVRLALTARAYRRRAAAEQAVRLASRALVVATTRGEVVACLSDALVGMMPAGAGCGALLIDHDGPRPSAAMVPADQIPATPGTAGLAGTRLVRAGGGRRSERRLGELLVPVVSAGGDCWVAFRAPARELVELLAVLEPLAEQAGLALARIDLAAALRAEERERYFRTLVLTSTDAILICRHGRVDYATPAAQDVFGRDVRGEWFDHAVQRLGGSTGDDPRAWADDEEGAEGYVQRPDGTTRTVLVHRRDLSDDASVSGVVATVRDVTAERELQRSLAYRASHDGLTGLANGEVLREQLRSARDASNGAVLCAVLFIDLDDFKTINDTYGHDVGDSLLISVAGRIRGCLRDADLAARIGGDEFAILLRDVPDTAAARSAAQRIADALALPVSAAGVTVNSQASVGLAIARTAADFGSLLRRADTALYTAKAAGRGNWRQYEEGMISPVRRRTDLRIELETAMRNNSLALHYQPIVDLISGQTAGFEALIRFDRADGPAMPPDELVRTAEDNGLIISLGDWVLHRALADATRINSRGPRRYVSLNVSPRQLRQPGFAELVRAHISSTTVDATLLVLEITESVQVTADEQAWRYLSELRQDGVRVAIDDYGTGCASLSYLRQSTLDIVKIDRSFLRDLTSERSRALLEAVISLSARLGLEQVAEGVEDKETEDLLRRLGCRYGQGYRYAAAMPVDQAVTWRPPPPPSI